MPSFVAELGLERGYSISSLMIVSIDVDVSQKHLADSFENPGDGWVVITFCKHID